MYNILSGLLLVSTCMFFHRTILDFTEARDDGWHYYYYYYYYYYYNHFMALWTSAGTTQVSQYQKVYFAIFWIFWCKMKITQADAPTVWMDCHPIQTNWCPHLYHPQHFYAGCPS